MTNSPNDRSKPGSEPLSRDSIAEDYFASLPFAPYPVQEEALLAWYTTDQGVLVCAPTGTGKTLIAEAAVYEALRTGKQCYYTTPLIALSDQKLLELQQSVQRWGFSPDDVGLVTGNRTVNGGAPVLVVVAEILLNRLLHPSAFPMDQCASVVMDEFHSFNDPERGVVWELTLGMLPAHVRTLLLSATVGNSYEFCSWLSRSHNRKLQLVQGTERKVPLRFEWIDDAYLDEHLERIAEGDELQRRTPGLVFCFNRDQCWQVAELLKGKKLIDKARQAKLTERLESFDLSQGAGPKIRAILQRGIGIHHAGILPRYRRIVEDLFQEKLLSIAVCTETLSAGINLPARSVILPTILKGPRDKKKVIEASSAHQIFGRAGRPQFDKEGFVYALAHEDDVKYLRWKQKYDSIPEDTKDPGLLRAKKQLKKKMPKKRQGEVYWTANQFEALRVAPPANLSSRGQLPWRLLAYLLIESPEVQPLRNLVGRRLMTNAGIEAGQRHLNQMLVTLAGGGYLQLQPLPAVAEAIPSKIITAVKKQTVQQIADGLFAAHRANEKSNNLISSKSVNEPQPTPEGSDPIDANHDDDHVSDDSEMGSESEEQNDALKSEASVNLTDFDDDESIDPIAIKVLENPNVVQYNLEDYKPEKAIPTLRASVLMQLRSVNPLYGVYLAEQLAYADRTEKILALESALELPANVSRLVRVPPVEELPFGPLATTRLHPRLIELGLATSAELTGKTLEEENDQANVPVDFEAIATGTSRPERKMFFEPPPRVIFLGEKVRRLFDYDVPRVHDVYTRDVWVVGELLEFHCDFNKYILARGFQRQEGILFRHVLRFVLLCGEFASIPPTTTTPETWEHVWDDLANHLTECCRLVDPQSTDELLEAGRIENLVVDDRIVKPERFDPAGI